MSLNYGAVSPGQALDQRTEVCAPPGRDVPALSMRREQPAVQSSVNGRFWVRKNAKCNRRQNGGTNRLGDITQRGENATAPLLVQSCGTDNACGNTGSLNALSGIRKVCGEAVSVGVWGRTVWSRRRNWRSCGGGGEMEYSPAAGDAASNPFYTYSASDSVLMALSVFLS